MKYKLGIIDLDGVCIENSPELFVKDLAFRINSIYPHIDVNKLAADIMPISMLDMPNYIETKYKVMPINQILKCGSNRYETLIPQMRPTPQIEELFLNFENCAIATNSTCSNVLKLVQRFGWQKYFNGDNVFSGRDLGSPKPSLPLLYHICRNMGSEPEESLVIDDDLHNLEEAKKGGFHTYAYIGGSHYHKNLNAVWQKMRKANFNMVSPNILGLFSVKEK